jgi:ribosome-associated protein
MQTLEFELSTDYIELIKLLKLLGICESGADAKIMVEEGLVISNKEVEYRKRKKVRKGDVLYIEKKNTQITIL